jgi:glycosyltransferase involved in cell wall biosynthesis
MKKLRIAHIITDLQQGGAETMLLRLLERMDRSQFEAEVISLRQIHPVGDRIEAIDIPVRALQANRFPTPAGMVKLISWLRQGRFDVVQTWMTHADLLGGIAARIAGIPVAWGIHAGHLDARTHGRAALVTAQVNARLSRTIPSMIICCSETSRREHIKLGYAGDKMAVIPNGFDVSSFHPNPAARLSVREELSLPPETILVGHVGRFHPQKDHSTLVEAARHLVARDLDIQFVLVGQGLSPDNATLAGCVGKAGVTRRFHLLGPRRDVSRLTASFDVACLSSCYGEAFPLVIGEAMACGVPCAATDCGDSAALIGDTGVVVPIRNPVALAQAIERLATLTPTARRELGTAARARIVEKFELSTITSRYEQLYRKLARRPDDLPRL